MAVQDDIAGILRDMALLRRRVVTLEQRLAIPTTEAPVTAPEPDPPDPPAARSVPRHASDKGKE